MNHKQQTNRESLKAKALNIDNLGGRYNSKSKLDDNGVMMRNDSSQRVYYKSSTVEMLSNSIPHSPSGVLTKNGQQVLAQSQPNITKIQKSSSEPRIRTFKQQILRIPKVKQILQKDKLLFQQDIQKRLQLIGDVKNEKYSQEEYKKLRELNKPLQKSVKKNRRHRTNYKIPLTRGNINSLNTIIQQHIQQNQHFKNEQLIYLSQQDYKEPFNLKKLSFMQELNPLKKMYKQKFPEFKQGVLKKNNLLLEHVILNRNIKREMKLDEKKRRKQLRQGERGDAINGQSLYERAKTVQLNNTNN